MGNQERMYFLTTLIQHGDYIHRNSERKRNKEHTLYKGRNITLHR
jgi:hypothetical protein